MYAPSTAPGSPRTACWKSCPVFLDAALTRVRALGYDLVTMDEALRRMVEPEAGPAKARPVLALTFDDGLRDTADIALPILERHAAPFTLYVTTGFADRTARLWWIELERAIRVLSRIDVAIDGARLVLPCADDAGKRAAFDTLYRRLRAGPEERLLAVIATLRDEAGLSSSAIVDELCLDWNGVARIATHPLCVIGAHTTTHPMLAKHDEAIVRDELADSRREIERHVGLPVRHLAYPVGDPTSVGPREMAIAADLGFSSAVTTRPRDDLRRSRSPSDRVAAPVAQRPMAESPDAGDPAVRGAVRPLEPGPSGPCLTLGAPARETGSASSRRSSPSRLRPGSSP